MKIPILLQRPKPSRFKTAAASTRSCGPFPRAQGRVSEWRLAFAMPLGTWNMIFCDCCGAQIYGDAHVGSKNGCEGKFVAEMAKAQRGWGKPSQAHWLCVKCATTPATARMPAFEEQFRQGYFTADLQQLKARLEPNEPWVCGPCKRWAQTKVDAAEAALLQTPADGKGKNNEKGKGKNIEKGKGKNIEKGNGKGYAMPPAPPLPSADSGNTNHPAASSSSSSGATPVKAPPPGLPVSMLEEMKAGQESIKAEQSDVIAKQVTLEAEHQEVKQEQANLKAEHEVVKANQEETKMEQRHLKENISKLQIEQEELRAEQFVMQHSRNMRIQQTLDEATTMFVAEQEAIKAEQNVFKEGHQKVKAEQVVIMEAQDAQKKELETLREYKEKTEADLYNVKRRLARGYNKRPSTWRSYELYAEKKLADHEFSMDTGSEGRSEGSYELPAHDVDAQFPKRVDSKRDI